MSIEDGQKKEKTLGVVRGSQRHVRGRRRGPRVMTREEIEIDGRIRARLSAVTDVRGNVPCRSFYRIRYADQHPLRGMARLVVYARARGLSLEGRRQLMAALREFTEWSADMLSAGDDSDLPRAA